MGLVPVGSYNNRDYYLSRVLEGQSLPAEVLDILADPQTSGGLLLAVGAEELAALLAALTARGAKGWVVGRVHAAPKGRLRVVQGKV